MKWPLRCKKGCFSQKVVNPKTCTVFLGFSVVLKDISLEDWCLMQPGIWDGTSCEIIGPSQVDEDIHLRISSGESISNTSTIVNLGSINSGGIINIYGIVDN